MRWGVPLSTSGPRPNSRDSGSEEMLITVEEILPTLRKGMQELKRGSPQGKKHNNTYRTPMTDIIRGLRSVVESAIDI